VEESFPRYVFTTWRGGQPGFNLGGPRKHAHSSRVGAGITTIYEEVARVTGDWSGLNLEAMGSYPGLTNYLSLQWPSNKRGEKKV